MVYGLGVDIAEISRFQRFLDEGKETLIRRIFTSGEIDYCRRKKRSAQHFALRFAAKEAFLKAAGLGLREGMTWHDVEIVNNELGKPDLLLHGRAAEIFARAGLFRSLTSLSHDGAYAVAVVVLEK